MKWQEIEKVGLPPPGIYDFKNNNTGHQERVVVRQNPNGSKSFHISFEPTHWREWEENKDVI